MKNLSISNKLVTKIKQQQGTTITTLNAPAGYKITHRSQINDSGTTLIAYTLTGKSQMSEYGYISLTPDGNVLQEYQEEEEITMAPEFFYGPDQTIWTTLYPYHPDKDLETFAPLFNRENFTPLKPGRESIESYIGNINGHSIFYDVDLWSDKKPDKMMVLEYKNGTIKKKHSIKITPRDNVTYIQDNELHLLAKNKDTVIHRLINEKGEEVRSREFSIGDYWIRQAILDFNKDSWLLTDNYEDNEIVILKVTPEGEVSEKVLWKLDAELSHLWPPVELSTDTYIIRFNSDKGNGWFIIQQGELIEFWSGRDMKGYKNLLNPDEVILLNHNDLIITDLTPTTAGGYVVTLYPNDKEKKIILLFRTFKTV